MSCENLSEFIVGVSVGSSVRVANELNSWTEFKTMYVKGTLVVSSPSVQTLDATRTKVQGSKNAFCTRSSRGPRRLLNRVQRMYSLLSSDFPGYPGDVGRRSPIAFRLTSDDVDGRN
jgi:hypothetical protein